MEDVKFTPQQQENYMQLVEKSAVMLDKKNDKILNNKWSKQLGIYKKN